MIKIIICFYIWTIIVLFGLEIDNFKEKPLSEKIFYITILFIIILFGELIS